MRKGRLKLCIDVVRCYCCFMLLHEEEMRKRSKVREKRERREIERGKIEKEKKVRRGRREKRKESVFFLVMYGRKGCFCGVCIYVWYSFIF